MINRVSLSRLLPGLTYDVEPSLAVYLIAQRAAEKVTVILPALVVPLDTHDAHSEHLRGGGGITIMDSPERAVAHDKPSKRRQKRR